MSDDDEIKRGDLVTDGRNTYTVMSIAGTMVQLQGLVGVVGLSISQLRKAPVVPTLLPPPCPPATHP